MCAWKILTSVYRSQGLAYYDGAGRKRFATQWSAERDRPIPGGGSCACRCPRPEGVPRGMALSRRRRHPHRVRGSSQGPGERRMTMSGGAGLSDLGLLSDARTFSISAENRDGRSGGGGRATRGDHSTAWRSEEHTSELQSRGHLVCRLLLGKKKNYSTTLLRQLTSE